MFSSRLQELRKSSNLSQTSLAKKLGVAQQTVAQWEKGTREPNIEMLIKISTLFSVSLDDLLGVGKVSDFEKMLVEVDKVEKRDIKNFLNKLYEDTKEEKIHWERHSDNFEVPEEVGGIINYNLSFFSKIKGMGEIALFYCIDPSDSHEDYTIIPEIHTQGEVLVLPTDVMTQRLVKKLYRLLEKRSPSQSMQKLSNFLRKYTSSEK